jgi:hypothetical protein
MDQKILSLANGNSFQNVNLKLSKIQKEGMWIEALLAAAG